MQQMVALPIIFIGAYLIITLLVAVFPFGRHTYRSIEDFHLASGSMGFWIISIGTIVSFYSGSTWTGWQGFISHNGALGAYVFPFIASSGILFYFLAEKIHPVAKKKRFFTVGDYLEDRYKSKKIRLFGGSLSFVTAILWIVMDLMTMGYVLTVVTQNRISFMQGEFVALIIILIYVLWGGIESIVWTDLLQGIIMLAGGVILCVFLLSYYFGGLENMAQEIGASEYLESYTLRKSGVEGQWISLIFVSSLASICFPATFVKMYMGKNIDVLRKSGIFLSLTAVWSLVYFIPGLMAMVMNVEEGDTQTSFLTMIAGTGETLALCFAGVFVLAVCIGSIDILLFTSAMCLLKDIGLTIKGPRSAANKDLSLARLRWVIVFTALVVFLLSAINRYALMDIALLSTQAIAQLFPSVAGAAYWKKASAAGALAGTGAGLLTTVLMACLKLSPFGLVPGFWGLLVNLAFFLIFSVGVGKKSRAGASPGSHL